LSRVSIAVPEAFRHIFWGDRHHRGSAQRGRYGLGARPGLRHPERSAERPTDALGRRASQARRDWSSPRSQRFSPGSQPSPGRTRSWPGTASWSPISSLARRLVKVRADRGSSARVASDVERRRKAEDQRPIAALRFFFRVTLVVPTSAGTCRRYMSHAKPLLSQALMRWRVFRSGTEHQIQGGIECRLWRGAAHLGATDHSRVEREPGLGLRPDRGRHGQSRVSKVLLIGERSLRRAERICCALPCGA
jgi:hypothetical protein